MYDLIAGTHERIKMIIQSVLFSLSLILTLFFFIYGFNHYYLINAARRYKPPALPDHFLVRPDVSVHLPVYNERYVIRRLVAACADMAHETVKSESHRRLGGSEDIQFVHLAEAPHFRPNMMG